MPKHFSVTLNNPEWSGPITAKGTIPDDEWRRLVAFVEYARELRTSTLLNRSPRWSYGFAFNQEEGIKPSVLPPKIEVRELAMLLRPFILQTEGTFFYDIVGLLGKHFSPDAFRLWFKAWRARFSGRDGQALLRAEFGGVVLNSEEGLKLWLNAYEFHRDEDKRAVLEGIKDSGLPFEVAEGLFVEMLTCQAEAVLLAAAFIEKLVGESAEGSPSPLPLS